jgi:hypothetical protein
MPVPLPPKGTVVGTDELIRICMAYNMWREARALREHPPPKSFASDGASGIPDTVPDPGNELRPVNLYGPAFLHDIPYYVGGTAEDRFVADAMFACRAIRMSGASAVLAGILFRGVRCGGVEWLPTTWRWGFGR